MSEFRHILIVQTAFPGDVLLTLPLLQTVRQHIPSAAIDMVVTPRAAGLLEHHPALREAIIYDKRAGDAGISGLFRLSSLLRRRKYDLAIVPHRSLRSAALVRLASIPRRVGFTTSAGKFMLTDRVHYDKHIHEVQRNLSLLAPLGIHSQELVVPDLYPSENDKHIVDRLLTDSGIDRNAPLVGIAPGTVWKTKQWLQERFAELIQRLAASGYAVALIGGAEDKQLCGELSSSGKLKNIVSAAGGLTFLQSFELIKRCKVLVTNDSAPMHLGVASRTPVVAIYGATVPAFGFAPYGKDDVVIETAGLSCRPCSIHGGERCPITTFDCMKQISVERVYGKVVELAGKNKATI